MAKGDPKLKVAQDDWALPTVDAQGHQVDSHGLPLNLVARAMQLASDGKSSDPANPPLVTPDQIAAQNPKGVAADQEAVAEFRIKRDWGDDVTAADLVDATPPTTELQPVDGAAAPSEGN